MARSSAFRCRASSCATPLRAGHFYCPPHWDDLLNNLGETIGRINRDARCIYIGRSSDPERRLLQHFVQCDRDHLAVLHWSSDLAEIERLESELIKGASYSRKLENEDAESCGSFWGHWNCVYASWTWKNGAEDLSRTGFRRVDGLYHPRLLPDCSTFPKRPDYLKAAVSAERAERILDELQETRAEWRERRQRKFDRIAR